MEIIKTDLSQEMNDKVLDTEAMIRKPRQETKGSI